MTVRAQVGECSDRITQWAEYAGYRAEIGSHGDAALDLARKLIAAGFNPEEPYETARGERVAMRYSSLRWAAEHTVRENNRGLGFVRYRPFDADMAYSHFRSAKDARKVAG